MDEYLSNWYQMNRNEIWYNSHLDLENKSSYVGYWAFEAAALVYLLDLDDSSLYKHLFYLRILYCGLVIKQNKSIE